MTFLLAITEANTYLNAFLNNGESKFSNEISSAPTPAAGKCSAYFGGLLDIPNLN